MPLESLSDELNAAGAQFRAEWMENPRGSSREVIRAWVERGIHDGNQVDWVETCSRCCTPWPHDSRWFYIRPPEQHWGQCRYCYLEYQTNYNRVVRKDKRRVDLVSDRPFGLELEFIGSSRKLHAAMRELGMSCVIPGYTHEVMPEWKIVPDGSVASGAELVSPILSRAENAVQDVEMACVAMRQAPVSTDASTGLHVHHTVRDLGTREFKRVVQLWYNAQTALSGLVSKSRRTQRWCRNLEREEVDHVMRLTSMRRTRQRLSQQDRYVNLNVSAYNLYGTLEVRWHQGTRDSRKILGWTSLFQALVEYAVMGGAIPAKGVTLESILARLEDRQVAPPGVLTWARERYRVLNATTPTAAQLRAQALQRLRRQQEQVRSDARETDLNLTTGITTDSTTGPTPTCDCSACRRGRETVAATPWEMEE